MERDANVITLDERSADVRSLRAVLREWGYGEREIQELLVQDEGDPRVCHDYSPVNIRPIPPGPR